MLSVLLSVVGIICIIISLIYINKVSKKEKDIYEEMMIVHENVKNYSFAIENTFNSFDDLIENGLNKIDSFKKNHIQDVAEEQTEQDISKSESNNQFKKAVLDSSNEVDNLNESVYEKVVELKVLGLSNEEIAKKLNKGIREVDMIVKIWSNV